MRKILLISTLLFIIYGCEKYRQARIDIQNPRFKEYERYRSNVEEINKLKKCIKETSKIVDSLKNNLLLWNKNLLMSSHKVLIILVDYPTNPALFKIYKSTPSIKQGLLDVTKKTYAELEKIYDLDKSFKKTDELKKELEKIDDVIFRGLKFLYSYTTRGYNSWRRPHNSHLN